MSDSATTWMVACQALLSTRLSRQEYWNGLTFPSLEDLPDPGTEPGSLVSPALDYLPLVLPGKPQLIELIPNVEKMFIPFLMRKDCIFQSMI